MGLKQNLQDIQTNLANAKTAIAQSITNKGVECSADEALSTYAEKIDNITSGGSGKYVVQDGTKFQVSTNLDLTNLDFSNVTDFKNMFAYTTLDELDFSIVQTNNAETMEYMFGNYSGTTLNGINNFDTSKVTNMRDTFRECSKLTSLDLSNWNTSKVTTMQQMFQNSRELTSLNLSNWNTINNTTMYYMFRECNKLTSLDISNWDVSNVTTLDCTFYNCRSLTSLDLSNWNTSNLEELNSTFYGCSKLTSLDLSNWNTSNVENMGEMFNGCTKLTSLDLSSFDTSKVTNMINFFYAYSNYSLVDLKLNDLGHNETCKQLELNKLSKLSKESVLFLFNNAFDRQSAGYTTPFNIKLHADTKALLTEDEIAIATNKGFTVV